jgi:hypothetical protein
MNSNDSIGALSKSLDSPQDGNSIPVSEATHSNNRSPVSPALLSTNGMVGKAAKSVEQLAGSADMDSSQHELAAAVDGVHRDNDIAAPLSSSPNSEFHNPSQPVNYAGGENLNLLQGRLPAAEVKHTGGSIPVPLLSSGLNIASHNPSESVGGMGLDLLGGLRTAELTLWDGIPYISPWEVVAIAAMGNVIFDHNGPYPVSSD